MNGATPGALRGKRGEAWRQLCRAWTWRMAWRDSRTSRRRLLFFASSIVLGMAALVAISSFRANLSGAIDREARTLLGADLVFYSRDPFTPEEEQLFKSIGGEQARQVTVSSMVYFPQTRGSRLVQVRALSGAFPFYGKLETEPPAAAQSFRQSGAVVEDALLIQFKARVGDPVRIGKLTLPIRGKLLKVPGENLLLSTIAPRVYIPMSALQETDLLQPGSLARYRASFKFPSTVDVEDLVRRIKPRLEDLRLGYETVERRKHRMGRSMDNLVHFLALVALVALLLGGVGVASAIHVHLKQKIETVAVLRCLGCSVGQAFAIYLVQAMALGVAGVTAGALVGIGVQLALPFVLADFLPVAVPAEIFWGQVGEAMLFGFGICLLFALLPLLSVRRISPLAAIRAAYERAAHPGIDPLQLLVYAVLLGGLCVFACWQADDWERGLGFAGGLVAGFALLAAVARVLMWSTRRLMLPRLPYVWRQGLANLYRPNNRTTLLMLSLGLGTFLILTLYLAKETLMSELISTRDEHQANMVLFDIQPDQKEAVADLVRARRLPVLDEVPIVTMRLASVKGRSVEDIMADPHQHIHKWALRREYRSTYRGSLREGEELVAGTWHASVSPTNAVVPISLEAGIADDLHVGLGDQLVFDVQGVPITNRVASLRKVDWRRIQPNFFVVFPRGCLEEAPAFFVLVTRVPSAEASAVLQRAVVEKFPNVSAIDLSLVLRTVDAVLSKVAFVVRFMAWFTVGTGLLVLAGAVLTGRFQRIRESILLRTLGASRGQIFSILIVEYAFLGALAAVTGMVLAVAAAWALAAFVFHVSFAPSFVPLVVTPFIVAALTVLTGLIAGGGILRQPPLAILRAENG